GLVDPATGVPNLWGTDGTTIFQCFAGMDPGFFDWRTKLNDFGAFTTRKILKDIAAEFFSTDVIDCTILAENESSSQTIDADIVPQNTLTFVGTGPITFVGTGPITWVTAGVSLARGRVQGFDGQYLGLRLTGTSKPFVIAAIAMRLD